MQTSKRLLGIGEYYFSQKLQEIASLNAQGKDIINLGVGSPDLPPHESVIKTIQETVSKSDTHGYQGYRGILPLRQAFAKWYKQYYNVVLDGDTEILPLMGSKEGIIHICMTLLNEGDEVLVPNPGYPSYTSAIKLAGGKPVFYHLKESKGWQIDLDALSKLDLKKIKMIWINYPHMPTGSLAKKGLFIELVAFAKKHQLIICHDNPYSFILNAERPQSILEIDGSQEIAIELNSLSKSHNMAGWRVGMLATNASLVNQIIKFKSNMDSGMFLGIQRAAITALQLPQDWYVSINKIYSERKEIVFEILNLLECPFESKQTGLFVWASISNKYKDGYALSDDLLLKKNVFVTPGGIFGSEGNAYIRISLCTKIERLHQVKKRILL